MLLAAVSVLHSDAELVSNESSKDHTIMTGFVLLLLASLSEHLVHEHRNEHGLFQRVF